MRAIKHTFYVLYVLLYECDTEDMLASPPTIITKLPMEKSFSFAYGSYKPFPKESRVQNYVRLFQSSFQCLSLPFFSGMF